MKTSAMRQLLERIEQAEREGDAPLAAELLEQAAETVKPQADDALAALRLAVIEARKSMPPGALERFESAVAVAERYLRSRNQ